MSEKRVSRHSTMRGKYENKETGEQLDGVL